MEEIECEETSMKKVMRAMFAVNETALYLDTHPNDEEALELHNSYIDEYEMAKKDYEKNYGPLSIYKKTDTWRWGKDNWPWEGGNN